MTDRQQCGVCGAFLPDPKPGERWRVCGKCGTESEIRRRIDYLEQALTPGTSINANTTFYAGKADEMRIELDALREGESDAPPR